MEPSNFKQANCVFGPPPEFTDTQVMRVHAYSGKIEGGSCDGEPITVVAWKPNELDLSRLLAGECVYLSTFGGLPPHVVTTSFEEAIHTA